MEKYVDYLRCGEIYKSPSHSNKTPYILKCYQCSDIFLLLESFIFHIEDYCKPFQEEEDVITPNSVEPPQEIQSNSDVDDALVVVKNEPVLDIDYENLMVDDSGGGDSNNSSKCAPTLEDGKDGKDGQMADGGSSTDDADEGNDDLEEVFEIDDRSDSEDDTNISGDNTLPLFVTNFMKSRSNVIDLIAAYKKQLHDKGLKGHGGLIEHKQYDFQKLTEQLNNKSQLNMNREQVAAIIKHLYREYREYLKSLCNNDKVSDNKPNWYFQYLDFLDPPKESNIYQIDNHRSNLSHELILKILDVYKGFPYLWDTNLAEYCCKNIRHEALEEMLWAMAAQLKLNLTQNSLKKYLRCIHNYFQKEKMRRLKHEDTEHMSDLLYKKMLFLADHVGPFICSDCNLEIKCPFMLKIHKFGIHGGALPFTCSVCEKQFRSLNSYVFHAKRHMHDLNIECKLCNRKFTHSSGLKVHMASHSESKTSGSCESESTARQRSRHEKLSPTVSSKGGNVVNIVSNRRYKTMTKYGSHMSTTATPANKCTVCGVLFKMKKSFNQHMKIHENNSNEA